jgi:hypothetical protein
MPGRTAIDVSAGSAHGPRAAGVEDGAGIGVGIVPATAFRLHMTARVVEPASAQRRAWCCLRSRVPTPDAAFLRSRRAAVARRHRAVAAGTSEVCAALR